MLVNCEAWKTRENAPAAPRRGGRTTGRRSRSPRETRNQVSVHTRRDISTLRKTRRKRRELARFRHGFRNGISRNQPRSKCDLDRIGVLSTLAVAPGNVINAEGAPGRVTVRLMFFFSFHRTIFLCSPYLFGKSFSWKSISERKHFNSW